jgi:uncharacterized protein (DUF488 family)
MMPATTTGRPNLVLSIGHSTRPLEAFLRLLRQHDVKLVADVRKLPGSRRNPQFDRNSLAAALQEAGIGYVHIPALGGLRRPQPGSPNGGWKNASFQAYADYMLTPEFERGLDELLAHAANRPTALMCAEAVPWRCHRSLIADVLVTRGISVEHILSATRSQPHELRPWARVQGSHILYPPNTNTDPPNASRD